MRSLTRRQWTAALAATVAAAPLAGQSTSRVPPQAAPAPEDKLQKAYADVRQLSDTLAKIEVPMNVEPAFAFKP